MPARQQFLSFGDKEARSATWSARRTAGLEYMFVMMNLACWAVGIQGLGISDRAYQQARAYANERIQGRPIGAAGTGRMAIIHHPDVRRMLMTMKAETEAMRAVAYAAARAIDFARRHDDPRVCAQHQARLDLMTPIVKGWCTERSIELTSLGVQIHGGMGYIEETGSAPTFPRCPHHHDLRGHHRHPGQRPGGSEDYSRRGESARALIGDIRA